MQVFDDSITMNTEDFFSKHVKGFKPLAQRNIAHSQQKANTHDLFGNDTPKQ